MTGRLLCCIGYVASTVKAPAERVTATAVAPVRQTLSGSDPLVRVEYQAFKTDALRMNPPGRELNSGGKRSGRSVSWPKFVDGGHIESRLRRVLYLSIIPIPRNDLGCGGPNGKRR